MEEILKTIETKVKALSTIRLRAIARGDEKHKRYLEGQLDALNTIYIQLWKQTQKSAQNVNTH